jgi:hypothetical protein
VLLLASAACSGASSDPVVDEADLTKGLGVEVKVTIAASDADRAVDALHLRDATSREVWFYDTTDLSLFEAGVILRARRAGGDSDATVKIRPARAKEITPLWKGTDGFKCEIDVTAAKSITSCSIKSPEDKDEIAAVGRGERDIDKLFDHKQEKFLEDHAPVAVHYGKLTPLGPIPTRVFALKIAHGRQLTVESWDLESGRVVEVSTRTTTDDAAAAERDMRAHLADHGLTVDDQAETKTRAALAALTKP